MLESISGGKAMERAGIEEDNITADIIDPILFTTNLNRDPNAVPVKRA